MRAHRKQSREDWLKEEAVVDTVVMDDYWEEVGEHRKVMRVQV